MSLDEVLPTIQSLSRAEQLHLLQFADLTQKEGVEQLLAGQEFPLWSPYAAGSAASVMLKSLNEQAIDNLEPPCIPI